MRLFLVLAWNMQFVILEWQVYLLTGDPLSLGLIGLMEIIPAISISLFAGHISDRSEKTSLLKKCILGFLFISLGMFLLTHSSFLSYFPKEYSLYGIYSLVFFGGVVRSFIGPSIFSLLSLVVPRNEYANASTWSSSVWQVATVLGPSLGGLLISGIGVNYSLLLVFGFGMVALIVLQKISEKPILNQGNDLGVFSSLREGLLFVWNTKTILGALTLDMVAVLFGGATALLPIYANDILKVGSEGFGILRSAPAVGALFILLTSVHFNITRRAGIKLLVAVFGFGLCIIVFGISEVFWISLLALFFSGVTDGVSVIVRQTILQLKTPDSMRGRVASVNTIFVGSSNELGAFESGVTAKLFGTVSAVVFGGSMTLLTVLITYFSSKEIRELDLETRDEE
ncbi:MAG: MFS transporter [Leptospiraceae bacterium]|nr:MFS transporter [Leptospiraceae bacterium]